MWKLRTGLLLGCFLACSLPCLAASPDGSANLSSRVNAVVDNAQAFGMRLVELPLVAVLGTVGAACAILLLLAGRFLRGARSRRFAFASIVVASAGIGLFVADRRFAVMERQIRRLQTAVAMQQGSLLDAVKARGADPRHLLFDDTQAEQALHAAFGEVQVFPSVFNEAADRVLIRIVKEPVHACMAIVDLTHPDVEICLDTRIDRKTLTSDFARSNRCMVAVNGEAGTSPAMESGLGDWIGNLVSAGKPVLLKDSSRRPFLAFDRRNRPTYALAHLVVTNQAPEWHNVIWGRHDALTNGVAIAPVQPDRQPRTALAIDKTGARLYLLVVDGRQPGYSVGLSRRDVGLLLAAFGARDGMLCDEGGSSCMYANPPDGILNAPCDSGGKERPTYTHFGVALRKRPPKPIRPPVAR